MPPLPLDSHASARRLRWQSGCPVHLPPHVPRLALAALAASLTATTISAQTAEYVVRTTANPCLRLRNAPSTTATQVGCLFPGTRVAAIESIPYWRRVRVVAANDSGWVAKAYLEPAPAVATTPAALPADAWLTVHFIDVGQGDGIWITTHDDNIAGNGIFEGKNIVIDGGPDSLRPANRLAQFIMDSAHVNAIIDALIVTHPHADHLFGARGILRDFQVRAYYDPGQPSDLVSYGRLMTQAHNETVDGVPARVLLGRDQFGTLDWGGELTAEILYAWPANNSTGLGSGGTRTNNSSIVLRLQYGQHSFLFVGDLEGKARNASAASASLGEARVLQEVVPNTRLQSTVLKVGHHGSETSSTLPFLQAVNPQIVVISSGRKNFSGTFLPDNSVINRLCSLGNIQLLRTDHNDASDGRTESNDADADHVVIRTNGTQIEVFAYSNRTRINPVPTC
jgi:competence protein ComEC